MSSAVAVSVPVSLSSTFFSSRDQDSLHALHLPSTSSVCSAGPAMLRATPGQAVHIDLGDGSALEGNAQDGRDGHDCVLLWDDASQSYILHRLSSVVRLRPAVPHAPSITPGRTHAPSPALTAVKTAKAASSRAPASSVSPSPRPPQDSRAQYAALHASASHISTDVSPGNRRVTDLPLPSTSTSTSHVTGLGITAPSTSRPVIGRKGILPSAATGPFSKHVDDDLASASEDSDDDDAEIEFEDFGDVGLSESIPAQHAPLPAAPREAVVSTTQAHSYPSNDANVVTSEEEDSDDESEADFDTMAIDLEQSLAAPVVPVAQQQQQRPVAPLVQQRPAQGSKRIPMSSSNTLRRQPDSDIASSSESDSD